MATSPKLASITILTGVLFYGLAIAGFGGWPAFFSHPALIAVTVSGTIMFAIALFSPATISSGQREDRSNRWVLLAFTALSLLAAYLPAYLDRHNIWTLDGETIRWVGVIVFSIGGFLRLYPIFVLGRRFSGLVAIQTGHTLVTDGIYRIIRHPSYLGLLMNILGWALTFRSIAGLLLGLLALIPLLARIRSEEKLLHSHFGAEYEAFRAQTRWRLIPGIY